jgi:predicted ArsR family transcriptional regulator
MITAAEILDAVKRGGMSNWRPPSEIKASARIMHVQQKATEEKAKIVLEKMGDKVWTCNQLTKHLGWRMDTVRDYLHRLVREGSVKKAQNLQPHKFWRINNGSEKH